MYQKEAIDRLIAFIRERDGIADKDRLAEEVQKAFHLTRDRKLYCCEEFAIRFSKAGKERMGNTVMSLAAVFGYNERPVIVCIVTPEKNYLLLVNATLVQKASHSSQGLTMEKIRGSLNGGDIMRDINGIQNVPENFEKLFAIHSGIDPNDNLKRIVEATGNIVPRGKKFQGNAEQLRHIKEAPCRAKEFLGSAEYADLRRDLDARVAALRDEIVLADTISNGNDRGRVIEYLITGDDARLKNQMVRAVQKRASLPRIKVKHGLGDYAKTYPRFRTETDIKSKTMTLKGNPKAYNIDKLLEFLSTERSVYLIYLLGIDSGGKITTRLCSVFDKRLLAATNVTSLCAGRNSRGVVQFYGNVLTEILEDESEGIINVQHAEAFLDRLLAL